MSQNPEHVILIHGAWAGAWVWGPLIREMDALGLSCIAPELPGNGHHSIPYAQVSQSDYLAEISHVLDHVSGPVALVGHSGGGMLVTAAAQAFPDRVSHAIWIAGMLLPNGQSFDDVTASLSGDDSRFGVSPHVKPTPDGAASVVSPEHAVHYFFHDLDADAGAKAAARLTPQPSVGRRIRTQTDHAFEQIPKLYLCATTDRTVVPAAQRSMAAMTANVTTVDIPTGHVPHVSHAQQTARIVSDWLSGSN